MNSHNLSEGQHVISIEAEDDAGKKSQPRGADNTLYTITVDRTPPSLETISLPSPDGTETSTISLMATLKEAETQVVQRKIRFIELNEDQTEKASTAGDGSPNSNPSEITIDGSGTVISKQIAISGSTALTSSGWKRVQIWAKDTAGNESGWLDAVDNENNRGNFIFDTTSPTVKLDSYTTTDGTVETNTNFSTGKVFSLTGSMQDDWGFANASSISITQNGENGL